MPWQPFRRKVKHRPLTNETEMETCFDDVLARSMSDGNLVRAPSERFLLSSMTTGRTKSYGTCTGGSSVWTHFVDHIVEPEDTLAGLSLRFNITIQDIKLANKIWTNDGLWPGRILKIPVVETGSTSLDLSGSSGASDTMSTSSSSGTSSRRLSSHDSTLNSSAGNSPYTKTKAHSTTNSPFTKQGPVRRASVEELQDFLSKMDSNIANSKKATISMIKKSNLPSEEKEQLHRDTGVNFLSNNSNNNTNSQQPYC